uniref:Mitochondrial carrier 1 n=1 Tax=Canis lupus familiaris TaxID=9615 RepID=A0A8C0RH32_CANLF
MGASDPEVAPWARGGAAGMAGAGAGAGARGGAAAGVEARARDPPPAHRAHPRHPRPAAQPSARRMDGASGGLGSGDNAPTTEALFVALGAGVTALSHPLLYVKLLIQVGHEPMPPTIGTNVLGRKVLYLPSFFTYAKYIVQVDGKIGLFRGLSPRLMSNALSTVTRGSMKKVFPPDEIEQVTNKDDMKTSLKKVVKETSYEMMMQCVSRMLAHPLHVISMRCMVQFVGREAKYSGLIPHLLGDVVFLWGCNLLAHFINAYLVDDSVSDTPGGLGNDQNPGSQFSQALAIRSYTKFVMGIAVSMLTYPFLLVGDLMAVNNCGLQAGLPPYSPVFKSWIHCWKYLSVQVSKLPTEEVPPLPFFPQTNQVKWCRLYIAWKNEGLSWEPMLLVEKIKNIDFWYKAFSLNFHFPFERM